jgi:hypothetical protein
VTREAWYLNGRRHRIDEPALQQWQVVDGLAVLIYEAWYLYDRLHRIDGPALREWNVVGGYEEVVLTKEEWYLKGVEIHPRILRQPVRAIERWWLFQQSRRQQAIQSLLWDSGMTVFPGFMGLLRDY